METLSGVGCGWLSRAGLLCPGWGQGGGGRPGAARVGTPWQSEAATMGSGRPEAAEKETRGPGRSGR